jgi:hypothetical protein
MVLIRLAHLADMPSPEELIKQYDAAPKAPASALRLLQMGRLRARKVHLRKAHLFKVRGTAAHRARLPRFPRVLHRQHRP